MKGYNPNLGLPKSQVRTSLSAKPAMTPTKPMPAKRMTPGAQGNANSTRMMPPSQRNLPLTVGTKSAAKPIGKKAMKASSDAFNKMVRQGKSKPSTTLGKMKGRLGKLAK